MLEKNYQHSREKENIDVGSGHWKVIFMVTLCYHHIHNFGPMKVTL